MHIREVWFKHFENFNPTHFGFNYSTVFKFFVFDHENSQIKIKKITKIKKIPSDLPTLPLRESVTRTTPFFWFGLITNFVMKTVRDGIYDWQTSLQIKSGTGLFSFLNQISTIGYRNQL
jgi:hypothetical protein